MLFLLALSLSAQAADCGDLRASLDASTPASVAVKWHRLATCDPDAGRATVSTTLTTALAGNDSHEALVLAIDLGAEDEVRAFLQRITSDERSKAIGYLGKKCDEHQALPAFFVASHQQLGDAFWTQRWYRGMAGCHQEDVQTLLSEAVHGDEVGVGAHDRGQFFSVLEVYARNLGDGALPTLKTLASDLADDEEITYVVNAFADAAGVGSMAGRNDEVAAKAIVAIDELGPELPARGADQARTTLLALGDERASNAFVKYRWPAAYRLRGYRYAYAVVALERITCTNGKKFAKLRWAHFTEPGEQWPDQLQQSIPAELTERWRLDGSGLCKGEYAVDFAVPWAPFQTDEERDAWLAEKLTELRATTAGYKKVDEIEEGAFDL